MPFFSVIVPLYNKQNDIKATLLSVINQSFRDFELIVINDGSTDDSEKEVLSLTDDRLVYIKTENKGVSHARNTGIEKATGNYIAFLDADDYWYLNHLEILHSLSQSFSQAGIVATNYEFLHPNNFIEKTSFDTIKADFKGIITDYFKSSLRYRLLCSDTIAVKKEVFDTLGGFDESLTIGEDTDMWIRMALKYPIAYHNIVTATYRLGASNRISNNTYSKHSFPKLDKFKTQEKNNISLQRFLDLYRASYALKHKLAGDTKTFRFYYNSINSTKNISGKTALLLKLPAPLLRMFYRLKQQLKKSNIHFDIYN